MRFRSANAVLRSSRPSSSSSSSSSSIDYVNLFSAKHEAGAEAGIGTDGTTVSQASQPLPAPPFIIAATIDALVGDAYWGRAGVVESVPGEADGFLARAALAISSSTSTSTSSSSSSPAAIILTGDSDLLLFPARVLFFRDLSFAPAASAATAAVLDPPALAASLGFPLLHVAYEVARDYTASLQLVQARLRRVRERAEAGATVETPPDSWAAEYALPSPTAQAGRPVEPRIGELLHQARDKSRGGREMFLPFLWDDPQRAAAWEVGAGVRAAAYALLFAPVEPAEMGTKMEVDEVVVEVGRRGARIVEAEVDFVAGSVELMALLRAVPLDGGDCADEGGREGEKEGEKESKCENGWWRRAVLALLCRYSFARGQSPPGRDELWAAAHMLSSSTSTSTSSFTSSTPTTSTSSTSASSKATTTKKAAWTWQLVHTFAQIQAAFYSLQLLRAVLIAVSTSAPENSPKEATNADLARCLEHLPPVAHVIDGATFLRGLRGTGASTNGSTNGKKQQEQRLADEALEGYWRLVQENDEAGETGEEDVNGNGKRESADVEKTAWVVIDGKRKKRKKRKKIKADGADGKGGMVDGGGGNMFAALAGM